MAKRLLLVAERPQVTLEDWYPGAPPDGQDLLIAVASLANVSVKVWANSLGVSRYQLRRLCKNLFGITPKEIIWCYILKVVKGGQEQGMSREAVALSLGYSEASSICHALASRPKKIGGRKVSNG